MPAACKGVGWGCCLPFDPHKGGNQPRGQGAGRESMGPLHFTPARGSRAGCGHLLGGALRQEWVACFSRGNGRQSWVHGTWGNRMVRTRWGDSDGTQFPIHPSPGFLLPSRNISRLHQIESLRRTTTPSMHHNCFACTLGVVVPLRSLVLFLLFPRALLMGWGGQSRGLSHGISKGTVFRRGKRLVGLWGRGPLLPGNGGGKEEGRRRGCLLKGAYGWRGGAAAVETGRKLKPET